MRSPKQSRRPPPRGGQPRSFIETVVLLVRRVPMAFFAVSGLLLAPVSTLAELATVRNARLQISVDTALGHLVEFKDLVSRQNFVTPAIGIGGLWEVGFNEGEHCRLSPDDAGTCRVSTLGNQSQILVLTWSDFALAAARDVRVEVAIHLEESRPMSRWTIAVEAPSVPARIRFPRILHLAALEKEALAMPSWSGLLARDPRRAVPVEGTAWARREFEYPGQCSLQCMTFYSEGGAGLYVASDDPEGYRKAFAAFSEGADHLNLELVHLPERAAAARRRYELPYGVLVGAVGGSWFDAATLYRDWALRQPWARASRWKRNQVADWVGKTGLWIWNRGPSPGVLDPAIEIQRQLGLPVSVFWHWWHGCSYDTGFPEYFPPREGAGSFMAALERAHSSQVHALVYMNQRLWGMGTTSWTNENAAPFAVKTADGKITPEYYNAFLTNLPCATMCLATDFWRSKYAGLAEDARTQLGVDGIYMDQACSSLACYDPRHGHPLGGGAYWMQGFRQLAADIRRRCGTRGGVVLAGEGCAENWLPYLDLFLVLGLSRERYAAPDGWEPIPFFHAVYHGYAVFYGNYSSLTMPPYDSLWPAEYAPVESLKLLDRKFSRQFCMEQARSFVWGQQPTVANFLPSHLCDRPEEIAFVVQIARLRQQALKYLQDGTMLAPPVVQAPSEEIPISRLSIYAGQKEALKEFAQTVPLVLASAWRAPDGRFGLAVVNTAYRSLEPNLVLDLTACGLGARGRMVPLAGAVVPTDRTHMEAGALNFTLTLAPLQARVFEWREDR